MTRTVLVTGSASGIGQATAALLRSRGVTVIGLDLANADIEADLGTAEGRSRAIADVTAMAGGKLDGVIACAGVVSENGQLMVAVNYFGTLAIVEGLRAALLASDAPRVAIISSSASILPSHPPLVEACLAGDEAAAQNVALNAKHNGHGGLAYGSTKLALSRWIRRTAIRPEWAGSGILINGIAPGLVLTPMTAPILATAEGRATLEQATPIAVSQYAGPQDIAPLLAFLASPDCRYMVGQSIFIDGGMEVILRGDARI
jgi:NAD(P)-dependent dehydrogenase (short-subunit alcohol dehydrogenase family)